MSIIRVTDCHYGKNEAINDSRKNKGIEDVEIQFYLTSKNQFSYGIQINTSNKNTQVRFHICLL